MKVLLLIDGLEIGGAETHVLTLARALTEQGTAVSIMCAGGTFAKELSLMGIRVFYAPFKGRDPRSILSSIRALRALKSEGFTVIHAHTRYTAALAGFALPRIPLVTTVHLNFGITPMQRSLCNWGRRTLAVSADLGEYLTKEYKIPKENISLTVNGIDPALFPPLYQRGRDILHVSRLDKDRSLCALLLCTLAPRLHAYKGEIRIRIYGDGDDAHRVKDAAKKANRAAGAEVVKILGSSARIAEEMRHGAMLIGVSRAALEGASRALPIILAGNDGYGGILTEEAYKTEKYANFCCRNKEKSGADLLYRDIVYLLEHACFCENIRWKICAQVQSEYTPRRMAEDALSVYRGALRIGAIGYYGYGNFGDEMMLKALCTRLSEKGIQNFYPLQKNGKAMLSRTRPIRTAYNLGKCDLVLFGGGNLFQNETSMRSLLYYSALMLLCKKRARIGACMGIGTLRGRLAEKICRFSLGGFSRLYLRSEADAEAAERLAPAAKDRIHTAADLCFYLPEAIGCTQRKNKLLFIPTAQGGRGALPFLRRMQAIGAEISLAVLFPEKDEKIAMEIAGEMKIPAPRRIRSESDFFECIKDARLCISMRLHGAIFSLLSHTPCLLSAHSEKNRAFIRDVRNAAAACLSPSPILPFLSEGDAAEKEKEAAGKTYGFSQIISFFRNRLDY
ncbi:MAG: glycosyltransferase [Clostridia bacterium]|nr:glycosyltransferase [Clostridia bacterium]